MNKKIIRYSIITLIFICIAVLCILFYLENNSENRENNVEELGGNMLEDYVDNEENNISKRAYFDINTCMTQYLNILNINDGRYYGLDANGDYKRIVEEGEIKKNIYDVLSTSYISKNNITLDNVYDYVSTISESVLYVPLEAKTLQNMDNIQSFIVHGIVQSTQLQIIDEVYAIVNIDKINSVFSIEPIYEEHKSITEITINQLDNNIENGVKFNSVPVSNENISKDYINIYKRLAIGNPEIIYNKLDEKYRDARFKTLEEFKKFIEENKNIIIGIRLKKYQKTTGENSDTYTCIDQNGNYYIFKEITPLKYTIILDNYTIPTEDFIEVYNSSREEEKVVLNIEKFFMGINDKNYKYSYNLLAESFRNNKYQSKEEFIKYVEANFFEKNEIEYNTYKEEKGVYIYKIKVSDATGKSAETKQYNMIVRLKEGTDFEMSFSEN